jgi:hypothetical protein
VGIEEAEIISNRSNSEIKGGIRRPAGCFCMAIIPLWLTATLLESASNFCEKFVTHSERWTLFGHRAVLYMLLHHWWHT